jgi:hypothetical protein
VDNALLYGHMEVINILNFCQLMGVILNQRCFEELSNKYSETMAFQFSLPAIIDIKPTVSI